MVELGDLSDDEFMQNIDAPVIAPGQATNQSAFTDTAAMVAGNTDNDNKPVDLSLFKTKLQRKLGIKESASTPLLSSTGKRKPMSSSNATLQQMQHNNND